MANPPFNVDLVDAERIKGDPRLPFGLPGVNKNKKVSNGNYLWVSYFHSYLNDKGRAGFVMSSQASSAGHGEKEVRRRIIETGDVDVMISIRNNFFYTRTVPCELWFFDRGKPKERRNQVLMIDARNIYRKVTRAINDFSPEQLANLAAIVGLYRGRKDRFLGLVKEYLSSVCAECGAVTGLLSAFDMAIGSVDESLANARDDIEAAKGLDGQQRQAFLDAVHELQPALEAYCDDRQKLETAIAVFRKKYDQAPPTTNDKQHAARKAFDPIAERLKALVKQADLICRLAVRSVDAAGSLAAGNEALGEQIDRRQGSRLLKDLDSKRKAAVEQLKLAAYFHKQIAWLQDHFPDAELVDVPGLVKVVDRKEIEAADWSLTPGRYVGVAPIEEDGDFDFEQAIRDIRVELTDLNKEAVTLAARIDESFEDLVT